VQYGSLKHTRNLKPDSDLNAKRNIYLVKSIEVMHVKRALNFGAIFVNLSTIFLQIFVQFFEFFSAFFWQDYHQGDGQKRSYCEGHRTYLDDD